MDYISIARRLRAMILEKSSSLTDEEAAEMPFALPKWKSNTTYSAGDRVRYGEYIYKVLTAHTSQDNWTPTAAPSLFARILPGQQGSDEEIGEWVQPDSTNPYMKGDKVRFEGKIYESLIDNNIWSPAAYPAGWQEITE